MQESSEQNKSVGWEDDSKVIFLALLCSKLSKGWECILLQEMFSIHFRNASTPMIKKCFVCVCGGDTFSLCDVLLKFGDNDVAIKSKRLKGLKNQPCFHCVPCLWPAYALANPCLHFGRARKETEEELPSISSSTSHQEQTDSLDVGVRVLSWPLAQLRPLPDVPGQLLESCSPLYLLIWGFPVLVRTSVGKPIARNRFD